MDPNTPEEQAVDVKIPLDGVVDHEEIMRLIEQHAPKVDVERWPRVLVMDDGTFPHALLERVRDAAMAHKIDVIHSPTPILEEVQQTNQSKEGRRVFIGGGPSILEVLSKILKDMPMYEAVPAPTVKMLEEFPPEKIDLVKAPPRGRQPSFKQFQQTRHNHGPSTRRQFAQIRPPRRGR